MNDFQIGDLKKTVCLIIWNLVYRQHLGLFMIVTYGVKT